LNIPNRRATGSFAARLNEEKIDRPKLVKRVTYIISGSGEFLARKVIENGSASQEVVSLTEQLGPEVSSCAPAYSVATLATEIRQ
jgi:uncharacterized hydantoinase/oxoprolinase family protein